MSSTSLIDPEPANPRGDGRDPEILSTGPWPGYVPIHVKYHGQNPARIFTACPHATDVRGFHDWLNAGRAVQKGQKGIRIQVPVLTPGYRYTDGEGEERPGNWHLRVKQATVFDISQTAPMRPREAVGWSVVSDPSPGDGEPAE